MAIGVTSLWDITDELIQLLDTNKRGVDFMVTDRAPDTVRNSSDGTYLSLYLFHVTQDKYQRNVLPISPVPGADKVTRAFHSPHQPLSLDLYYLLTAYAKDANNASRLEQQAMTAALKCFHENPIVTATLSGGNETVEFTMTLQPESTDSLGRLWQSVTSSLRLSAIYKISVVFVEPSSEVPSLPEPVQTVNLAVSSASLPFADAGQVVSTYIRVNYIAPVNTGTDTIEKSYELVPAVVAPGQTFILYGSGPRTPNSGHVYLLLPNGTEQDVTSWIATEDAAAKQPSRFMLTLPDIGFPVAGVYQLRVGNNVAGNAADVVRSNATPFSIAAWVDPGNTPLLSPSGSTYTLTGKGFIAGNVDVLLETVPLMAGAAASPGQFVVISSAQIDFQLPAQLSPGLYGVRVRVNQVESPPAKWVEKV